MFVHWALRLTTILGMVEHRYALRSKDRIPPCPPGEATLPLCSEDQDLLLRTISAPRGGLLSSLPPPKKLKANTASAIVAACDFDPFSLSDLTELEDSDVGTPTEPPRRSKKRRR